MFTLWAHKRVKGNLEKGDYSFGCYSIIGNIVGPKIGSRGN